MDPLASAEDELSDIGARTYIRDECVVFRKTSEPYGGLSNMAPGFPIRIGDAVIVTTEALYQACRFPHRPEVQRLIIEQHSPMTAKMRSKPHRKDSRSDWENVRVEVMRWCLRVKLAQNRRPFGELLLSTGNRTIVEESARDAFWGARPRGDGTLLGQNVLGRLLMELRDEVRSNNEPVASVAPPAVPRFLLLATPIAAVSSADGPLGRELSLFDQP